MKTLQPITEVEALLIDHVQTKLLTQRLVEKVAAEIRAEVERQLALQPTDLVAVAAELDGLRAPRGSGRRSRSVL